jgi:succinate dehydrogenase/fumarate reductase cytochrome b subunit
MDPTIVKTIIIVCLVGIVASLSTGLFHLVSDKGQIQKHGARVNCARSAIRGFVLILVIGLVAGMATATRSPSVTPS